MPKVLKLLVSVCLVGIFLLTATVSAKAEVFQFSKGDAKYLAALALALAEEGEEAANVEEKINLDEDLEPADFGLNSVGLLPDSPFYFTKNIRRGVASLFTFNTVDKAKLKLRFASEKLLEANELAKGENVNENDVRGALNGFRQELDRVKAASAKAARSNQDQKKSELSEKVMDSVVKFGKNLGKFEKTLSPEAFDNVKEAREKTAETFGAVFDLSAPDDVSAKLTEILDKQKGSEFKHFKNLEILEEIEEKVPDQAKEAIRLAQENALNRLQSELEKLETAKRAIFSDFVRESGGNETRHLAILNELEVRPLSLDLRNALTGAKEETFIKTEEKLKKLADKDKKEKFLAHLTDGEFEDFRLMKEIEENVGEDTLRGISEIRLKVEDGLKNRVAGIKTNANRRQEFEGSVERFHDIKSLSLIDKMEELASEDQRVFFTELKQKAVAQMEEEIASAGSRAEDKTKIYQALAGDRPEYFGVAEGLGGVLSGIKNAMYGKIGEKAKNIRNKEKLLRYEEEFKDQQRHFTDSRDMEKIFSERKSAFNSPETVRARMAEVKKLIAELEALANSLPIDRAYTKESGFDPSVQEINNLLAIAKRKLDRGRNYFDQGEIEKAFFVVDEAEFLAGNGIDLVAGYRAGQKKYSGPKETMEIRNGFVYIYSKYDLGRFCSEMKGFLRSSSECVAPDGDVFSADSYPVSFPLTSATCSQETGCSAGYFCNVSAGSQYGKCVLEDEKISTCQALFTGYIYDQKSRSCNQVNASGCFDPYVYHAREECEKANKTSLTCPSPYAWDSAGQRCVIPLNYPFTFPVSNFVCNDYQSCYNYCRTVPPHNSTEKEVAINDACSEHWPSNTGYCGDNVCSYPKENEISCSADCKGTTTKCPLLPTVESCPAGEKRVVTHSSRDCGEYFGCVPLVIDTYCGDGTCNGGENSNSCPRDCGVTTQNWVKHPWTFNDGLTETSMIFNRTDLEYLNFISKIEAQCRTIPKKQFAWKSGAGNDDSANWQNFGIPDCSGTAVKDICGDNVCQSVETKVSCPSDCSGVVGKCGYFSQKDCAADSVCAWVEGFGCGSKAQCNDGIDNDKDGFIDYPKDTNCVDAFADNEGNISTSYCGDKVCQSNETSASCSTDCGGTSTTTTTTTDCSASLVSLLGTGCHYMYNDSTGNGVYCDGPMTKSAKSGDTTTQPGCSSSGGL